MNNQLFSYAILNFVLIEAIVLFSLRVNLLLLFIYNFNKFIRIKNLLIFIIILLLFFNFNWFSTVYCDDTDVNSVVTNTNPILLEQAWVELPKAIIQHNTFWIFSLTFCFYIIIICLIISFIIYDFFKRLDIFDYILLVCLFFLFR